MRWPMAAAAADELLEAAGAARGGARRLPGLLEPPPRFSLALRVADAMAAAGEPVTRRRLADAVAEVLALAGEDEPTRGLEAVLRAVLEARRTGPPTCAGCGLCAASPPRHGGRVKQVTTIPPIALERYGRLRQRLTCSRPPRGTSARKSRHLEREAAKQRAALAFHARNVKSKSTTTGEFSRRGWKKARHSRPGRPADG